MKNVHNKIKSTLGIHKFIEGLNIETLLILEQVIKRRIKTVAKKPDASRGFKNDDHVWFDHPKKKTRIEGKIERLNVLKQTAIVISLSDEDQRWRISLGLLHKIEESI